MSVVWALEHLHSKLLVIFGDMKSSDILVHEEDHVKVCDFGISSCLVDLVAKMMNTSPTWPQRINSRLKQNSSNINSNFWSLGIAVIQMALLRFPYGFWGTLFQQLKQVVEEPLPPASSPPFLP